MKVIAKRGRLEVRAAHIGRFRQNGDLIASAYCVTSVVSAVI